MHDRLLSLLVLCAILAGPYGSVASNTPAPTVAFTANPLSIAPGQSSTLIWSATNVDYCMAGGGWSGIWAHVGAYTVTPAATTLYSMTCYGSGGTVSKSVTVTVGSTNPPPTLTFSASPTTINSGQSSTLSWSATNATSCTASGGWTGTKSTAGSQSVSPTATTTYTLACTGAGGTTTKSATVTVSGANPPPTVTFSASPTTIASGQSSTLTWSATNATSCTASGGWTGTESTAGSQSVSPTATTTYTLACTGPGGTTSKSATVTVSDTTSPTLMFIASPAGISPGQTSQLIWTATNATSCLASGGWSGTKPLSSVQNVSPNTTTVYTLTCTGPGGSVTQSVTVIVSVNDLYNGSGPVASWNAYLYKAKDGIYHQALLISHATQPYPVIGYAYSDAACKNLGDTFNDFSQSIGNGLWWFTNHPELQYVQWIWYSDSTDQQILQQTPCIDYSGAPNYN
jgi:hypothetical protein